MTLYCILLFCKGRVFLDLQCLETVVLLGQLGLPINIRPMAELRLSFRKCKN